MRAAFFTLTILSALLAACTAEITIEERFVAAGTPDDDATSRPAAIVGGKLSNAFAATGALVLNGQHQCTATLVGPSKILTAAHCVADLPQNPQLEFVLGPSIGTATVRRKVVSFSHHPSYGETNQGLAYDSATATLASPISNVLPVVLYLGDPASLVGKPMLLVGFGRTEKSQNDYGTRREASPILKALTPYALRYDFQGTGACYGDSGGPAFMELSDGWRQVGITSSGTVGDPNCQEDGLYSRLDVSASWLSQQGVTAGERTRQCGADGACDGICQSDPDCASLGNGGGGGGGSNGGGSTGAGILGDCTMHSDCKSGVCVGDGSFNYCSLLCQSSSDCPIALQCLSTNQPGIKVCAISSQGSSSAPQPKAFGQACSSHASCVSQFCAAHPQGGGYCTYRCDFFHGCPAYSACYPTQYSGFFMCGPPGY